MRDPMSPRPKRAGLKMRLTIKQQDRHPQSCSRPPIATSASCPLMWPSMLRAKPPCRVSR